MNFSKQYSNEITAITDGLSHGQAVKILETKERRGLLPYAVIVGYRDAVGGVYDKYWRYSAFGEKDYCAGVQAAIKNGACIETYIEVATPILTAVSAWRVRCLGVTVRNLTGRHDGRLRRTDSRKRSFGQTGK